MNEIETAKSLFFEGLSLFETRDYQGAELKFREALRLVPNRVSILTNLSAVLIKQEKFSDAYQYAEKALSLNKDNIEAILNLGLCAAHEKKYDEALASYDKAISLQPDYAEGWSNRGNVLNDLKRREEALASYDKALSLKPDDAEAWSNRGNVLYGLERYDEALASYDSAISFKADHAEAWSRRGNALCALKRHVESLGCYHQALTFNPTYANAWYNHGNALSELKRCDEALGSYDKALSLKPDFADAWYNRGNMLCDLKRHEEALASYDKALSLKPDYHDAAWNQALASLTLGQLERGWQKYEFRWKRSNALARIHTDRPQWMGNSPIQGKRILVWSEQGFGDTIQFCRYISVLREAGAQIFFEVHPALKGLMSSLDGCRVIVSADEIPEFDYQIPLLSLPLALKTNLETIPSMTPYLSVRADKIDAWRRKLCLPANKLNIGIACSGNATQINDQNRSMPLAEFAPLTSLANLFLIQKDIRSSDELFLKNSSNIKFLGDEITDFEDSASIVSNLDLIVSVDTSLVHLAGALNKPVWTLLTWVPDWRWLLDRSDSPWYPSATLVRQGSKGDWRGVMCKVVEAMHRFR